MNRDTSFFWDLTAKHLSGTTTPEEEVMLADWLEQDAVHRQSFAEQRRLWELSERQKKTVFSPDAGWQEFLQRVEAEKQKKEVSPPKSYAFPWMRVAAGLALLLVSVFLLRYFLFSPVETITVAALEGKRQVTLPDSSQVWLKAGSTLSYTTEFGEENREVTLQGEGYFEVRHNPQKPFTVSAAGTETEVLGTTFQVSTQKADQVAVVLFTGKVSFRAKEEEEPAVILAPGQTAIYFAQTGIIKTSENQNQNVLAWKEDRLQFRKATLQEVTQTLEEYYGIRLSFENPALAQCHFTGTFSQAPTLEEVLQVLSRTVQISYEEVQPNEFLLKGNGCE